VAHIGNLEPCEATYPHQTNEVITCTTERMVHGPFHRSSEKAFGPSSDPSTVTRALHSLSSFFKVGYRPVWTGNHSFNYGFTFQEDFQHFTSTIQILSKLLPSNYFLTRISILQKSLLLQRPQRAVNASNFRSNNCWICLSHFPDSMFLPCMHVICSLCLKKLSEVKNEQVPITLEALSLEDKATTAAIDVGPILPTDCPICKHPYTRVMENQSGKRNALKVKLLQVLDLDK